MVDSSEAGTVSQWNEGNLKSLRLHESQEMINVAKVEPLKYLGNNTWNYNMWISGVNILYGEGQSKYGNEEILEVEKIKELIVARLLLQKTHKTIKTNSINGITNRTIINYENWEKLRKLIEIYEQKVKLFNDKHGLSTRNYDDMDDGL